jgi:hypothetical protein
MRLTTLRLGRKGFTISPFFLIALILLGALLVNHFQQTDQTKQKQIMDAGEKNKQYLEVEEDAAKLQSLLMFISYQAVYEENHDLQEAINTAQANGVEDPTALFTNEVIKKDLETKIQEDLNRESGTSFTVKIDYAKINEGFIVTASGGQMDSPNGKVPVTLEKFINARIFLLNSQLSNLRTNYMQPLAQNLTCKFRGGTYAMSSTCQTATLPINDGRSSAPGVYCNIVAKENPIRADMPNYDIRPEIKTPGGAMTRIQAALVEVGKGIAIESNKNRDGIASSYQIKSIVTTITPTFTEFEDPLAVEKRYLYNSLHCCGRTYVPPVRDSKNKIITPGYYYCSRPDHDYRGSVDIKAEIKILANFSDHAKIADATSGNFKICTTSPIMINTGKVYPLELSYEFTVPVVIHITNLFQECKSSQPKPPYSAAKITGFPTYTIDLSNLKYTPDPVICGSSVRAPYRNCLDVLRRDPTCGCGR